MKVRIVSNSRGLTLVETLIALAISTVVALTNYIMISNQIKSANFIEDKLARIEFEKELKTILEFPDACKNSLSGFDISSTSTIGIKNNSAAVVYNTTSNNRYAYLKILGLELKNLDISSAGSPGFVEITATIESVRPVIGPKGPFVIKVKKGVQTESGSWAVKDCDIAGATGTGTTVGGEIDIFNNPGYTNTTPVVAGDLTKYSACWIQQVANAENSHYCRVYLDTDNNWKMRQYKTGCKMACRKK